MAYINPAIDDSEQNKFGPTGTTTPSPQGMAPPMNSGSAGSGSAGGPAPTQATSTQFGSSASKLSDYLSANAPQIESMGSDIAGKLNTQYGQLQGDINKAGSDFGSAVQGGYAASNPDLVNRAASDPTSFVKNAGDVSDFQKQLNDSYSGPQNFESFAPYSKVQGDVSNAVQGANLLKSSGGLSSYLQNQSQGQYTPGMNTLDTTLLQANPNAQKMVTDATQPYAGLTDYLNQTAATANAQVAPAQQAASDAAANARNTLNPVATNLGNTLNTQLAGVNTNRDAYNSAVTKNQANAQQYQQQLLAAQQDALRRLPSNTGNAASDAAADELVKSFFQPGTESQLSGLAPYLSGQPVTQPGTLANTATAGQYGEDAALAQLLGSGYQPRLDQSTVGQAGSYSVPGMPGTVKDPAGQIQYMGDVSSLYSNPGIANIGGINAGTTPAQLAQTAITHGPGQGWNVDAVQQAALQRLVANQYAGRT